LRISLLLIAATARLFSQPVDGAPLLRQVTEALRTATRFHFDSVSETEMTGDLQRTWMKRAEVLAKDGPERIRYELTDLGASYVVVSDGKTVWRAAPDTREFIRSAANGPLPAMKGGGPVAEAAVRRLGITPNYLTARLTDRLVRAEETGTEWIEFDGKQVECVVVRADYAAPSGAVGIASMTQTYRIDRQRLIVLKDESVTRGRQYPDRPFDETMTRHSRRYLAASVDQPLPDSLFVFTPPASYRETDRLERAFPRPAKDLIGKAAPELSLPTLTGETVRLADLRGKIVLLEFWATWCEPCRKQMPALAKLYAQTREQGVVLLGVNNDETPQKARQFLQESKYEWQSLFDTNVAIAWSRFKVPAIPTMVLIDREGKVVAYEIGAAEGAEAAIRSALRNLGINFAPAP
jgi:peroxiredoxin/outer membrane lipoprotein-sorting protein